MGPMNEGSIVESSVFCSDLDRLEPQYKLLYMTLVSCNMTL